MVFSNDYYKSLKLKDGAGVLTCSQAGVLLISGELSAATGGQMKNKRDYYKTSFSGSYECYTA